jgi:hypothetical protein
MSLAEHLAGLRDRRTRAATHCSWEMTARPANRLRELLSQFRETYDRLPAFNRQIVE